MTHARPTSPPRPPTRRRPSAAFTLVELLVAMGIIVLMLGLAMPAFRAITGGRSVEGATNQVSAMLARARADAVGLQIPRGVAFYTDATGQCKMAEVGAVVFTPWAGTTQAYPPRSYVTYVVSGVTYYYISKTTVPIVTSAATQSPNLDTTDWQLFTGVATNNNSDAYFASTGLFYDQLPGTDPVPLPLGVAAQVISDSGTGTGATRTADAYLHDGLILFDASGRLVSEPFVLSQYGILGKAIALTNSSSTTLNVAINATSSPPLPTGDSAPQPLSSSFGLVLYDRDAHDSQGFPPHDPIMDATGPSATYGTVGGSTRTPADEEAWLDANATPLLINRYTGALVRGE